MPETALENEDERRCYELAFLQTGEDSHAVREVLRTHGAEVTEERPLEKVHLAYPIGKQLYAFMGSLKFTAKGNLTALRTEVELTAQPLRFLIHRAHDGGIQQSTWNVERPRTGRPFSPAIPSAVDEPLTNEALEKKISEILQ